jgi:hypothetical protein
MFYSGNTWFESQSEILKQAISIVTLIMPYFIFRVLEVTGKTVNEMVQ